MPHHDCELGLILLCKQGVSLGCLHRALYWHRHIFGLEFHRDADVGVCEWVKCGHSSPAPPASSAAAWSIGSLPPGTASSATTIFPLASAVSSKVHRSRPNSNLSRLTCSTLSCCDPRSRAA